MDETSRICGRIPSFGIFCGKDGFNGGTMMKGRDEVKSHEE